MRGSMEECGKYVECVYKCEIKTKTDQITNLVSPIKKTGRQNSEHIMPRICNFVNRVYL